MTKLAGVIFFMIIEEKKVWFVGTTYIYLKITWMKHALSCLLKYNFSRDSYLCLFIIVFYAAYIVSI